MTRSMLLFVTMIVSVFLGFNFYTYSQSPKQSISLKPNYAQISIPVEGMTCLTCEFAVQSAIKKIPGVDDAQASAKEKIVRVSYDSHTTSLDEIVNVINRTGYKAKAQKIEGVHG